MQLGEIIKEAKKKWTFLGLNSCDSVLITLPVFILLNLSFKNSDKSKKEMAHKEVKEEE